MNLAPASTDRPSSLRGRIRGLYAVTPDELDTDCLVRKVQMALAGGARVVQYRNKLASVALRREQAVALLTLCRTARTPLIVNDELDLVESLDADGLHVGRNDMPIDVARARLGKGKVLGASCYDRLTLAVAAYDAGADYVAFGSAFPSSTKPGAVQAPLSLYAEAKMRLACPVVAIGGITIENARGLVDVGVDAVAVISALFDTPSVESRAQEFARMFHRP